MNFVVMALMLLRLVGLLGQTPDVTNDVVTNLSDSHSTATSLTDFNSLPVLNPSHYVEFSAETGKSAMLVTWRRAGFAGWNPGHVISAKLPPSFSGDPSRCAGLCPSFEKGEVRPGYQVRSYPASFWVSTSVFSDSRVLAELQAFDRLHTYLQGRNDPGVVLNLSVPLLTQIQQRNSPGARKEAKDYTVSLYLGPFPGPEPPYPLTNEIVLERVEARTVFVQRFRAHLWDMTDRHVKVRANRLRALLQDTGEAFLNKYFYLASYARPQLYNETDYELWLFATRFRDSSHLRPRLKAIDPPLSRLTAKTMQRVCRGLECPRFDVLRVYKYGIQKRRYFDAKLASYSPEDCEFSRAALWKGFMPLHLYKHGVNSHLEMLEATRPIGILYVHENRSVNSRPNSTSCSHNYTVSFYLPARLHSNPPTTGPQGPRIRVTTMDDLIVYVHTAGGYILEPEAIVAELKIFTARLRQFGLCFRPHEYYVAVYDFVVRFHGRLNEIWLVAKKCDEKALS